jgi:hypothetical protein
MNKVLGIIEGNHLILVPEYRYPQDLMIGATVSEEDLLNERLRNVRDIYHGKLDGK